MVGRRPILISDVIAEWVEHYHHDLNRLVYGLAAGEHRAADERSVFVWLDCAASPGSTGSHLAHKQARTFAADKREGRPPLRCPYCCPLPLPPGKRGRVASEWEHQLLATLESQQLRFAVEASVVLGWSSPVDYWLFEKNIIVQCDGEHHDAKPMFGVAVGVQRAKDSEFNTICWQQGLRVVRVHRLDTIDVCCTVLNKAVQLAATSPASRFVLFSPSCQKPDWIDPHPPTVPFSPISLPMHGFVRAIQKHYNC